MIKILLTSTALLFASTLLAQTDTSSAEKYLLIGAYTKTSDEGISVYAFNTQTGAFRFVSTAKNVENPSYMVISPDHKYVYAVNETNGNNPGNVSAFEWDTTSGQLTFLNKQPSGGDDPCYITTDQDGKYVVVANYSGGSFSILPVKPDGRLEAPVQTIEHTGSGPNKERQEKPHVHCVYFSPDHHQLYVSDLGIDQIAIYNYRQGDVQPLVPATPGFAPFPPGSGPRHLVFHPNGKWAYVVHELDGKITAFHYDNGKLTPFQAISILPDNFKGKPWAADLHISSDGKFLYATNRDPLNNILTFSINSKTGNLVKKGETPTGGKTPRNFVIDPTGNFLLIAHQGSNNVTVFKRDKVTGLLKKQKEELKTASPVCLKFIGSN